MLGGCGSIDALTTVIEVASVEPRKKSRQAVYSEAEMLQRQLEAEKEGSTDLQALVNKQRMNWKQTQLRQTENYKVEEESSNAPGVCSDYYGGS